MDDFQEINKRYTDLKVDWERHKPLWDDISRYVGIEVNAQYLWNNEVSNQNRQLDEFVDDPTAALSVNQAGDYMLGIAWGTGDKVFDLIPSRYVKELVDDALVADYYSFATDQSLYHMNHPDAGLSTAFRPYMYDQFGFGTSGIGVFKNKSFEKRIEENALLYSAHGIDNLVIDEGKGGQVDIGFVTYHWRVSRIVAEFCDTTKKGGTAKLPKPIRDAYENGRYTDEFDIVFGFFPREDYDPKYKGKRGTKYRGVWFMSGMNDGKIFHEEDFADRPIAVARAIKIRGDVYGRASGTMLLSSIRSVNYIVSNTIQIMEKMGDPSLGILNNALFGDSVLDTSPQGLTVFNSAAFGSAKSPIFPIHDVGDPTAMVQFLIPYLNEKIVSAFKIDILLDFSSAKAMTATESLQRYAIRGKSLSGMAGQQKNECLVPITRRSVNSLMDMGELGVNPTKNADAAKTLRDNRRSERVIPDAVLKVMESGRPWYEIRWNNELEKLTRTEAVQNLLQMINSIGAIAGMYPDIIEAIDWFALLKDINDNLDTNNKIMLSADEFKAKIQAKAQMQQAAMALQGGQMAADIQKNTSQANKNNNEALRNV